MVNGNSLSPRVSLIGTVLNEGESIRRLLDSIAAQTRPPDEIVIVDGGSADHTVSTLREYQTRLPLKVIVEPGCNISRGRNAAIEAASGEIIAVTDAGVVLKPDWLEKLIAPLQADQKLAVSCGFFEAEPHTLFEAALGATTLPLVDEIRPETFLPSSRSVAFRKAAWQRVGGYPEWLDYCEDLIFDLRLKLAGQPFAFAPEAVVYFRPRKTLRAFFKQYYLYARGDGKADLWRRRHAIRYLTYLAGAPALLLLGLFTHPLFLLLLVAGGAVYLRQPYRRLLTVLRTVRERGAFNPDASAVARAALLVPVIRAAGDIAKMIGYPVGWRWRLKHRPPDWTRL